MANWQEAIEDRILSELGLRLDDLVTGAVQVDLSQGFGGGIKDQLDRIEKLEIQNQILLRFIIEMLPGVPRGFKVVLTPGPNLPARFEVALMAVANAPVGFEVREQ